MFSLFRLSDAVSSDDNALLSGPSRKSLVSSKRYRYLAQGLKLIIKVILVEMFKFPYCPPE